MEIVILFLALSLYSLLNYVLAWQLQNKLKYFGKLENL